MQCAEADRDDRVGEGVGGKREKNEPVHLEVVCGFVVGPWTSAGQALRILLAGLLELAITWNKLTIPDMPG
jgi:hypothetical protein